MCRKVTKAMAFQLNEKRFSVDASEVGLSPGEWPVRLETELGDGHRLLLMGYNGEDESRYYGQPTTGLVLTVYND